MPVDPANENKPLLSLRAPTGHHSESEDGFGHRKRQGASISAKPRLNTARAFLYISLLCNLLTFVWFLNFRLEGLPNLQRWWSSSSSYHFVSNKSPSDDALTIPAKPTVVEQEELVITHTCPSTSQAPPASPPAPINPWAQLTPHEANHIQSWLYQPEQRLNLSQTYPIKASDNSIFLIEAYAPPKADVLTYFSQLEQGKNRKSVERPARPPRYARVTIHHGGIAEPEVRDYLVGPLPIKKGKTTLKRLAEVYHRPDIPFNARGLADLEEVVGVLAEKMEPLGSIMEDLFSAVMRGGEEATLSPGISGPFSYDGKFRRLWLSWRRNVAGSFLLPVGLYCYIDISGTDPSKWDILKIVYHEQIFNSVTSFVEAYKNGTLRRHDEQADPELDLTWPQRTRLVPPATPSNASSPYTTPIIRDLDHLPGPRTVSFSGLRFRVDPKLSYVSWLGWGLYLSFDRDMGLSLWDVRFRGERILYELKPQEALVQYAGNDPVQGSTVWLDRYFGMGMMVRDLIPNYDCPSEAIFLPATTYVPIPFSAFPSSNRRSQTSPPRGQYVIRQRAICIFEQETGRPLTRHYGDFDGEFGATKGYTLTVRSVASVGNYDYRRLYRCDAKCAEQEPTLWSDLSVFDYIFNLDGTIEVKLSASGYMQGGYWNPSQDAYGARIREFSMGNVHDHVINFKVDLDIDGTANSLLKTTTEVERLQQPWLGDDWGQEVVQQKIIKEYVKNEDEALLRYPPNFRGGYAVVNKDRKNKWGNPRGYAVHAGYSPVFNTVVGSKRLEKSAHWAQHNLAVSKRKETEPSSSSMWNLQTPGAPVVDFKAFFNGEGIEQEDLVAWVNVGMHHLPSAEDSPMTKTNVATSSFVLTPLNYFDYDISLELRNAILFHPPEQIGADFLFDENGVENGKVCLPERPPTIRYNGGKIFAVEEGKDSDEELGQQESERVNKFVRWDMYLRL